MKRNKYMFSYFAAFYIDAAHLKVLLRVLLKVLSSFVCVLSICMWILKYCALNTQHISPTLVVL